MGQVVRYPEAIIRGERESDGVMPNLLLGLLACILVGPLLLPWPDLFVSVTWSCLLTALALQYRTGVLSRLDFRFLLPVAGLFLWTIVSLLWSEAVDPQIVLTHWLPACLGVLLFVITVAGFATDRLQLGRLFLLASFAVSFIALFSLFWQFVILDKSLAYRGFRIAGSGLGNFGNLYNPIDAGLYYGVFAVIIIHKLCLPGQLRLKVALALFLLPTETGVRS